MFDQFFLEERASVGAVSMLIFYMLLCYLQQN